MKILMAGLGASMLIACGSESGVDATVYVDAPSSGDSCVGVAGFEVIVSPAGQAPHTDRLVDTATILDARSCRLPLDFSVASLEIDVPLTVTVNGYDGSGTKVRVSGRQTIQSLRDGPVHLDLKPASLLLPLLVFDRNPLLDGVPITEVTTMVIAKQMGMETLLSVDRPTAGVFLNPEPGAYGMPTGLAAGGTDRGLAITVSFTADGRMIKESRLTVDWNGTYYTAK
jgi:hypothetical protein